MASTVAFKDYQCSYEGIQETDCLPCILNLLIRGIVDNVACELCKNEEESIIHIILLNVLLLKRFGLCLMYQMFFVELMEILCKGHMFGKN